MVNMSTYLIVIGRICSGVVVVSVAMATEYVYKIALELRKIVRRGAQSL